MTTDQLRNVILEAVDCLRMRKCRPDRESIAVYVMRKLGSSMNEIFSEIENIVDEGSLLKVEYKGSTSYRSPKSFDEKNSPLLTKHSKILNSSKTTRYVISAINELLSNPLYAHEGIPFEELKKKLMELDKDRFAEGSLKVIFEREEAAGSIQVAECDDKEYPLRIFPKDIKVPEDMKLTTLIEDTTTTVESNKKKKKQKKEAEVKVVAKDINSKPPAKAKGGKGKAKDKEQVVYAVKSSPHKVEVDASEEVDPVKTKAQLLNSIGIKVVTGKASAIKASNEKPKAKSKKKTQIQNTANSSTDAPSEDEKLARTPSLTLVNPESTGTLQNTASNPALPNGKTLQKKASSSTPSKSVKLKRKIEVQDSGKPPKVKKQKLAMDPEPDVPLRVRQKPPRYTYASKKRPKNEDGMEDDDDELINSNIDLNGVVDHCVYCRKDESPAGSLDDFLLCGTCGAKIHPACIDYTEDQAKRLKMNSDSDDPHFQWQCFSCKRCGVCRTALMSSDLPETKEKTDENEKIPKKTEQRYILCDQCDRGYHVKCIGGTPTAESSWYCPECKKIRVKNHVNSVDTKKKLPLKKTSKGTVPKKKGRIAEPQNENPVVSSTKNNKNGNHSTSEVIDRDKGSSLDSESPDISLWTPNQVQKFFTEKGLPDEAASLREQEIDGASLLLLRRADVIFGLNLRLGPALKIYRLVCQLQQHASALKKKSGGDGSSSKLTKSAV